MIAKKLICARTEHLYVIWEHQEVPVPVSKNLKVIFRTSLFRCMRCGKYDVKADGVE